MRKKLSKLITIFLIAGISISAYGGCMGTEPKEVSLSYNLGHQPESIDPALSYDIYGADVILACFEGLMRMDENNKPIPGIAASYTKDSDVKYTFKLREARWSDGRLVTAKDFEYAWKRVLTPETGSKYAYQLYCIKNAEAYNKGQTSADNVGIKAVDEKTLEVTLETPISYFLELLTSPIFMPVREDVVNANSDGWTDNPSTYIGNGPFKMVSLKPGDSIEFIKNENYYSAERVKISKLVYRMIEQPRTYLTAWETGDVDVIESPPSSEIKRLKSENKLTMYPYLGVYFYTFNTEKKPLNDKKVRKALAFAIDRVSIINNITKNEAVAAEALVPNGISDVQTGMDFRKVGGVYIKPEGQIAEARRLLAEAGYPEGKGFPKLTLSYNDSGFHGAVAKAVHDMWEKNLGINVDLQAYDASALQNIKLSGAYDIARHGWIADYMDPLSFLEIFSSDSANNISRYSNPSYDKIIGNAYIESDPQKRMNNLHDAERILMDDMPIVPIYYYTNIMLIKPYVKGILKSPMGYTYFDQTYIE